MATLMNARATMLRGAAGVLRRVGGKTQSVVPFASMSVMGEARNWRRSRSRIQKRTEIMKDKEEMTKMDAFWSEIAAGDKRASVSLRNMLNALAEKGTEQALEDFEEIRDKLEKNNMLDMFGEAEHVVWMRLARKLGKIDVVEEILEKLRATGGTQATKQKTVTRRAMASLMNGYVEARNPEAALKVLQRAKEQGVRMHNRDYSAVLEAALLAKKRDIAKEVLDMLCDANQTNKEPPLSRANAEEIIAAAKESGAAIATNVREVGFTGRCTACKSKLLRETEMVDRSFLTDYINAIRNNVFIQKKSLDSYRGLLDRWLNSVGPFKVIVDSANVTYHRTGDDVGSFKQWTVVQRLQMISSHYEAKHVSHCFVIPEMFSSTIKGLVSSGKSVVLAPRGVLDDVIVLYIAIWSQLASGSHLYGRIVTNDQFRDVALKLTDHSKLEKDDILDWVERNTISHEQSQTSSMRLNDKILPYKEVAFANEDLSKWHIPLDEREASKRPWLCIQFPRESKKSVKADGENTGVDKYAQELSVATKQEKAGVEKYAQELSVATLQENGSHGSMAKTTAP